MLILSIDLVPGFMLFSNLTLDVRQADRATQFIENSRA